jgi:hypothetical protein
METAGGHKAEEERLDKDVGGPQDMERVASITVWEQKGAQANTAPLNRSRSSQKPRWR